MNREYRNNRSALFDGIEEGGIRAAPYSSHEIDEQDNDRAMDGLQDRVLLLKRLTGDIHEEVESHNRVLDGMGNEMDASRGILSGTMDRFKMVFETKSSRRMFTLVASFVIIFLIVYYMTNLSPTISISLSLLCLFFFSLLRGKRLFVKLLRPIQRCSSSHHVQALQGKKGYN